MHQKKDGTEDEIFSDDDDDDYNNNNSKLSSNESLLDSLTQDVPIKIEVSLSNNVFLPETSISQNPSVVESSNKYYCANNFIENDKCQYNNMVPKPAQSFDSTNNTFNFQTSLVTNVHLNVTTTTAAVPSYSSYSQNDSNNNRVYSNDTKINGYYGRGYNEEWNETIQNQNLYGYSLNQYGDYCEQNQYLNCNNNYYQSTQNQQYLMPSNDMMIQNSAFSYDQTPSLIYQKL